MSALYTDLSRYYDLMCSGIDYRAQSDHVQRLQQLFGNGGRRLLDLGCGSGPHVRHFVDAGYEATGLDLNAPMLEIARVRCPEARFIEADMRDFDIGAPVDLVTCFLYSIHYNRDLDALAACFAAVHRTLAEGGIFCFNTVDKRLIQNTDGVVHTAVQDGADLAFRSSWHYPGTGSRQQLRVRIDRTREQQTETWQDTHEMVAVDFDELQALLAPLFTVDLLEHRYDRIEPWNGTSGNVIAVCTRR